MQGAWFNPDMNSWISQNEYAQVASVQYAWELGEYYKTIEFIDGGQLAEQWQGCFKWNKMDYDPLVGIFNTEPLTVYYRVNDSSTQITLYCPENDYLRDVPFQILSPYEMMIDGELYICITDNPTPMVTLPNRNWHYDWSSNGFYYTGAGAWMYDYNNPTYSMNGSQLCVTWGTNMNQAVRPYANYEALAEVPKGMFNCTSGRVAFEQRQIDYNGTQVWALVQVSGGNWFDRVCEYAFAGCKELNALKLGGQIIEEYAFYGCSLKHIFLMSPIPDSVAETAFDEWQFEHTVLHTREEVHTSPWNRFKHSYADIPDYVY